MGAERTEISSKAKATKSRTDKGVAGRNMLMSRGKEPGGVHDQPWRHVERVDEGWRCQSEEMGEGRAEEACTCAGPLTESGRNGQGQECD